MALYLTRDGVLDFFADIFPKDKRMPSHKNNLIISFPFVTPFKGHTLWAIVKTHEKQANGKPYYLIKYNGTANTFAPIAEWNAICDYREVY